MSFWSGYVLSDFIFKDFNTKTVAGFVGVCVALTSVGILYEGLYLVKKQLYSKFLAIRHQIRRDELLRQAQSQNDNPSLSDSEDVNDDTVDVNINPRHSLINDERFNEIRESLRISRIAAISEFAQRHESFYLFLSSVLHSIYVFIGYCLMNAVMTFNIYVLIATCIGIAIGYFVFRTEDNAFGSEGRDYSPQKISIEASATAPHNNDKTDVLRASPSSSRGRESNKSPSSSKRIRLDKDNGNEGQTTVIVVGAQVHMDCQQSI